MSGANEGEAPRKKMKLRDIAHARAGDKGDTCNISLIAFDERDYPRLVERATADRVQALFGDVGRGGVTRYELPHLGALNFVLTRALGGGVTRSLFLDAHGKSLSSLLLDLEI
jgi:hypothetical protein